MKKIKIVRGFLFLAVSAGSLLFRPAIARGELLFSDSFAYPAGLLAGQGPPADAPPGQTGWTAISGNPKVMTAGLEFANVFATGGGTLFHGFAPYQDASSANLEPVDAGVVWIGFMINNNNNNHDGFADVRLGGFSQTVNFGLITGRYTFGVQNDPNETASTLVYPSTQVSWLVLKLDFDRGTELLFVNPATEPVRQNADAKLRMDPSFQTEGFSQVTLEVGLNNDIWHFDEVRVGTTFQDLLTGK